MCVCKESDTTTRIRPNNNNNNGIRNSFYRGRLRLSVLDGCPSACCHWIMVLGYKTQISLMWSLRSGYFAIPWKLLALVSLWPKYLVSGWFQLLSNFIGPTVDFSFQWMAASLAINSYPPHSPGITMVTQCYLPSNYLSVPRQVAWTEIWLIAFLRLLFSIVIKDTWDLPS